MFDYHNMKAVDRIAWSKNALTNARTPPYLDRLAPTYTDATLAEGLALVAEAAKAHRDVDREHAEQYDATDDLTEEREATYKAYMVHVGMARVAFEGERGILEDLGLDGPRAKALAGWLDQAHNFYSSALERPELHAKLAQYRVPEAALTAGLEAVERVQRAQQTQLGEIAGAQGSTEGRRDALEELDAFMPPFIKVCRLVFRDDPQMLEGLGIPAP